MGSGEALLGPHGAGHSDTALSSREAGKAPVPLSPLPLVGKQQGHSLLPNSYPGALCLVLCARCSVPPEAGRRVPGSCLGTTKREAEAVPNRQALALGKEGVLNVK